MTNNLDTPGRFIAAARKNRLALSSSSAVGVGLQPPGDAPPIYVNGGDCPTCQGRGAIFLDLVTTKPCPRCCPDCRGHGFTPLGEHGGRQCVACNGTGKAGA